MEDGEWGWRVEDGGWRVKGRGWGRDALCDKALVVL
jgi:hypothetical protein